MANRERVLAAVYLAIEEFNESSGIRLKKTLDQSLFGRGGALDSLGMVNLIVAVETAIEDELGLMVTLADERAMSQQNSPFLSVKALVDYVAILVDEANGVG